MTHIDWDNLKLDQYEQYIEDNINEFSPLQKDHPAWKALKEVTSRKTLHIDVPASTYARYLRATNQAEKDSIVSEIM